jgi:hypothetical protein
MSEEQQTNILALTQELFGFMRDRDVEIPIAMGAFATSVCLMAAKLHIEQPDLLKSFENTMEIVYADYADDKEHNTH